MNAALILLDELLQDLDAHEHQEGQPVEFRNQRGSWEDVKDRIITIKEVLS